MSVQHTKSTEHVFNNDFIDRSKINPKIDNPVCDLVSPDGSLASSYGVKNEPEVILCLDGHILKR